MTRLRGMVRIENRGGSTSVAIAEDNRLLADKRVFAEGDSWFDKFTPLPAGTNLLDAMRTEWVVALHDRSHVGDEIEDMVKGRQARQAAAMFDLFRFDAILLSAGGNDFKNVFRQLFEQVAAGELQLLEVCRKDCYAEVVKGIVAKLAGFIELRDGGKRTTSACPILLHGYDYFQPRPAGAKIFAATDLGPGPWLYPAMKDAGLTDAQMRDAAKAAVDTLNEHLEALAQAHANVRYIDQRGVLTPAEPGSRGNSNDWQDEIHPNDAGFHKLAEARWNAALKTALA